MAELRKLATIMSVDVAGYSRMAEASDSAAAEAVGRLTDVLAAIAAPLSGRIFNTAGDGVMLEFPVASAGVQAAVRLLAETKSGERPLPQVRIGLHLGEVIVAENGDLLGHGVNVAARLQALAAPGTAMVSIAVQAQVRSASAVVFAPQGRVHLDKMAETMEVFSLASPGEKPKTSRAMRMRQTRRAALIGAATVGVVALAATPFLLTREREPNSTITPANRIPRLAVLRLERLGDVEPYFADGLAEELINEVAKIKGLEAVGRTSSFALEGKDATPEGAARLLEATVILEGSVRRIGSSVRVAARLVAAPDGRQLWADTFEDDIGAIYTLQRKIALGVSRALSLRVSEKIPPHVDPQAYELYLRGKLAWLSRDRASRETAVALFEAAVATDQNFAAAWSALALTSIWPTFFRFEGVARAEVAAERAIALDRNLAEPVGVKANIALARGQWRVAVDLNARALAMGGSPVFVLSQLGFIREALEDAKRAVRLDPLNYGPWSYVCQLQLAAGDYEAALVSARRSVVVGRYTSGSYFVLQALLDLGRHDDARAYIKEIGPKNYAERLAAADRDEAYVRWRLGDGPAPNAKAILRRGLSNDDDLSDALELLAELRALPEATILLDKFAPKHVPSTGLFDVREAPLRRLPAFWRAMDRVGLTAFWRESGKWPDVCATENVCPK